MSAVDSSEPAEETVVQGKIVQNPLILSTSMYDMAKYEPVGSVLINYVHTVSFFTGFMAGLTQRFTLSGGQNERFQRYMNEFQAAAHEYFMKGLEEKYHSTVISCVVDYKTNVTVITLGNQTGPFPIMTISGPCLKLKGTRGGGGKSRRRRRSGKKSLRRRG